MSTQAGGVATVRRSDSVELMAREYAHPAVAGRSVVRLVRTNLREVEDLSLGVLGLEPQGETPVGYVANRAVGFPAWPIIHDPGNAQHALNLVADLQRAAKLARSSVGQAKARLETLAATLGSSAPHFLPTFLEEAARVFLGNDSRTHAAQFFTKAREAERVHNLAIDEQRHREVLLEFALAGALSAKELTNESKSLLERTSPQEALDLFVSLNLDRVKGGLPPYAGLGTDLRRLIKAAKADQSAVEQRLARALLDTAAVSKAPGGFWKHYRPALIALAAHDADVRARLLEQVAVNVPTDDWVELMEATGLADQLRAGTVDVAGWAERQVRLIQSRWQRYNVRPLSLLLRECPALRGQRVLLTTTSMWRLPAELVDALLGQGALIEFDGELWPQQHIELTEWAASPERSDLKFLAADDLLATLTAPSVKRALNLGHLDTLADHEGSRVLLRRWATPALGDEPTLPQLQAELERLEPLLNPAAYAVVGEQLDALIARFDAAELVATGLRGGFITELMWPALEQAARDVAERAGGRAALVTAHESWPAIGVAAEGHVAFVDGDRTLATASFAPAGSKDPHTWLYTLVDGVVGCMWQSTNNAHGSARVTWSNDLGTTDEVGWFSGRGRSSCTHAVPGGRLVGLAVLRPGDAVQLRSFGRVWQVGERYWMGNWTGVWELAPATGRQGRESLPTAVADLAEPYLRDGYELVGHESLWHEALPTTLASPVSTHGGVHGWLALRSRRDYVYVAADGSATPGEPRGRPLIGRIDRPGGGSWLVDDSGQLLGDDRLPLSLARDEAGEPDLLHRVPAVGWHQYRVRDLATSERMRTVTAAEVVPLLEGQPVDTVFPGAEPALAATINRFVAEVQHAVAQAAEQRSAMAPGEGGTFAQWPLSIAGVLWIGHAQGDRDDFMKLTGPLRGEQPTDVRRFPAELFTLAAAPEVLVAAGMAPCLPTEYLQGLAALLGAFVDSGAATATTAVFTFPDHPGAPIDTTQVGFPVPGHHNALIVATQHNWQTRESWYWAIAPDGVVPPRVGEVPTTTIATALGDPLDCVRAFEILLAEGPPPWDAAAAAELARQAGWSVTTASILLAALPHIGTYGKNFLPRDLRELLGLKVADADAGRQLLRTMPTTLLAGLLRAGAKEPLEAVTEGLDVRSMADLWRANSAHALQLPEDLLAEVDSAFRYGGARTLRELAASDAITLDRTRLGVLLWLAYRLDGGDPLRPWVGDRFPALIDRARSTTWEWSWDTSVRRALGLPAKPEGSDGVHTVGAWRIEGLPGRDAVTFNAGAVQNWDREALLIASMDDGPVRSALAPLLPALTGEYDELITSLDAAGAGPAQDPLVSASDVVKAAATHFGVPEESARYWLQLLALPNPTDKNIDAWNGWTKADRARAAAPLQELGLLVEAKRARAGRSLFLPGGWQEASTPHLPMEVWKAPLFELKDAIKVSPVLEVVVPTVPCGHLFADAWERYASGDVPGYTALRTERYRRGRS